MTWGLNTRTSATWGGRKRSHSETARALQLLPRFQMQLVWVANFYLFAQDPWYYANVREQLSKVSRMFCKVHCFCFQRAGLNASAITLLYSLRFSLLIGWYAMRCTFEAMGNPEEFFKEATGHTWWQMIRDANVGPGKCIRLDCSCQNFHTKHVVKLNSVLLRK